MLVTIMVLPASLVTSISSNKVFLKLFGGLLPMLGKILGFEDQICKTHPRLMILDKFGRFIPRVSTCLETRHNSRTCETWLKIGKLKKLVKIYIIIFDEMNWWIHCSFIDFVDWKCCFFSAQNFPYFECSSIC